MTRWGLLLGLALGVVELLFVRGPTPGGASLWAMVLAADALVVGGLAWIGERLAAARLPWIVLAAAVFVAGARSDEARQGALSMPSAARYGLVGLRAASDVDRDGYGAWLGQHDCAPWDPAVHPAATEIAGNGVDDNCLGGDLDRPWSSPPPPGPSPPGLSPPRLRAGGVLLITIDSVRADHVGAYGYARETTPNLDALARRGTRFDRAYSPTPATRWSLPMLHTSRWTGEVAWDRSADPHALAPEVETFAERLAAEGVRTGAAWPLPWHWGLKQGFEVWTGPGARRAHRAQPMVGAARRFLANRGPGPWFFWLHLYDPHLPYAPREEAFGARAMDRYDAEIRAADAALGKLLDELPPDAAVIVTADHGEEFGEHGGYAHRDRLYEELIRVPLIVSVPDKTQATTASAAGLLDLAPTIGELLGVPFSGRGRSLIPDLLGHRDEPERPIFASLAFHPSDPSQGRAVVRGVDKLIFDPVTRRSETFDLATDPLEKRPRSGDPAGLMRLLIPFIERTGAP